MIKEGYKRFIQDKFEIVNKDGLAVPFVLNSIQEAYTQQSTGRDIILKARQQGFSSFKLAQYATDFLLKENSVSIVVADIADNATALLEKVKYYLKAYETKTGVKIPLKYNSKYELYLEPMNSKYQIGTAENVDFGRSKTITNLHLSEAAFYKHLKKLLAGALQAVVPEGDVTIETTANGFNEFKEFWDQSVKGETGFAPLFYKASDFYSPEFLERKRKELGDSFRQEYPESAEEAFLTSGSMYFDHEALEAYLKRIREPLKEHLIYV
ncbi:MAG: hypothetical protein NUV80_03785 [Candidatus Berkelbacteria bacterium]|nr:hypothetical protein [Candidatus Berkelbacteria bacterium]